jgi:transcriptional regulator with AAA-type ATPase domain
MAKRIMIINEDPEQKKPRSPRSDEIDEILNVVLAQLIRGNQGERNLIEFLEEKMVQIALEQASGNKSQAAASLGVHRKQLERRVKKCQKTKI